MTDVGAGLIAGAIRGVAQAIIIAALIRAGYGISQSVKLLREENI